MSGPLGVLSVEPSKFDEVVSATGPTLRWRLVLFGARVTVHWEAGGDDMTIHTHKSFWFFTWCSRHDWIFIMNDYKNSADNMPVNSRSVCTNEGGESIISKGFQQSQYL